MLFRRPAPWAPQLIDHVLQPLTPDWRASPDEIALVRALVEVPANLVPVESELNALGFASVRRAVLQVFQFARWLLGEYVRVAEGARGTFDGAVAAGTPHAVLGETAALLVAASGTARRFQRKGLARGSPGAPRPGPTSAWDAAFVRVFHAPMIGGHVGGTDTPSTSAGSLVRLAGGLAVACAREVASGRSGLEGTLSNALAFLDSAIDAGLPTLNPERALFIFMATAAGVFGAASSCSIPADPSQFAADHGFQRFANAYPHVVHYVCRLVQRTAELGAGHNFTLIDSDILSTLIQRTALCNISLLGDFGTVGLWRGAVAAYASLIHTADAPHAPLPYGARVWHYGGGTRAFTARLDEPASPTFGDHARATHNVLETSAVVMSHFTRAHSAYIVDVYSTAPPNGAPLVVDCCPPALWGFLAKMPSEELDRLGQAAAPLAAQISGASGGSDIQQDPNFLQNVALLAWFMTLFSEILAVGIPLDNHFRACCVQLAFEACAAAESARLLLGRPVPAVDYLEASVVAVLRAAAAKHIFIASISEGFILELAGRLGVALESEPELRAKVFGRCAELISSKLLQNVSVHRDGPLRAQSVGLLRALLSNPHAAGHLARAPTIQRLTQLGPVAALSDVIDSADPPPSARRLAKGLSAAIAVALISHDGEKLIISFLHAYHGVLARAVPDGAGAEDEYIASTLRVFYALRGISPVISRRPRLALTLVKFLNYSMANISRILSAHAAAHAVSGAVLRVFCSFLQNGIHNLEEKPPAGHQGPNLPAHLHAHEERAAFVGGVLQALLCFIRELRRTVCAGPDPSAAAKPLALAARVCRLASELHGFDGGLPPCPVGGAPRPSAGLLFVCTQELLNALTALGLDAIFARPSVFATVLNAVAATLSALPTVPLGLGEGALRFVWRLGTAALHSTDENVAVRGGRVLLPILMLLRDAARADTAQKEGSFPEFWLSSPRSVSVYELPSVPRLLDAFAKILPPIASVGAELVAQMVSMASHAFTRALTPIVLLIQQLLGSRFFPAMRAQLDAVLDNHDSAAKDLELVLELCNTEEVSATDVLLFADEVTRVARLGAAQ